MQLVVDDFGAYVKKNQNRFQVLRGEQKEEFSADKVTQIVLLKQGTVSGGAVALAMENNIDIVYLNHFGEPYARIYPCKMGGTTLIRRKQALASISEEAANFAQKIIKAKVENQYYFLKSLSKSRNNLFQAELGKLEPFRKQKIYGKDIPKIRNELLGNEGMAASLYFAALTKIIPFEKREHKANDKFNALLNYGYGILYSEIERSCVLVGLDPYLGFLHTDRYGKPSFVLDFIEQFRHPIIDRVVVTLFAQKQVQEEDFETAGSLMLSARGKKKIVEAVYNRLAQKIQYGKKKLTLKEIIVEKSREFVRFLLNDAEFKPFVYRWD